MVIWYILTALNLGLVLGLYGLVFIAVRNIKKRKQTKVSVKQVSPKK